MPEKQTGPREIWVQHRQRHTPAHRIAQDHIPTGPDAPPHPGRTSHHVISCPPGMVSGGYALTRKQALELSVFPCVKCFDLPRPSLTPPAPAPLPGTGGGAAAW